VHLPPAIPWSGKTAQPCSTNRSAASRRESLDIRHRLHKRRILAQKPLELSLRDNYAPTNAAPAELAVSKEIIDRPETDAQCVCRFSPAECQEFRLHCHAPVRLHFKSGLDIVKKICIY
jgi:hypothetical protein